ncbi:MAG TPA: LysM peptidoglycan-binding domain-containing protein, partial [Flavobacterium sp.]
TKIKVSAANEIADAAEPKAEFKTVEYTVRRGDFLGIIAKKNNITLAEIKEWNSLEDNNIHAGQKLIVAKTEVVASDAIAEKASKKDRIAAKSKENQGHYLVRKGDSLFSIAQKYPGVTISDIKKWNGIRNENIKPGMKLKING